MFTGIIEEVGEIDQISITSAGANLVIHAPMIAKEAVIGESIAVNGACITVTNKHGDCFQGDLSEETLNRTSFPKLHPHTRVNLERSMTLGGRMGGHLVSGHIDCPGTVQAIIPQKNSYQIKIEYPSIYRKYCIEKGSISVDGISLTIGEVNNQSFTLWVIPHTWENTNLKDRHPGDTINLEYDLIGKYVENMMIHNKPDSKLDMQFLSQYGFI